MREHKVLTLLIGIVVLTSVTTPVAADPLFSAEPGVDHTPCDRLLHRHVSNGLVDYQGLLTEEAALDTYLASLADLDPARLPSPQAQLAFWINAYNACVIKGVLDAYPIKSVKDVKGFFDRLRYRVGGESLTLNEIEAKGRALGDWRIHFAVACASSSCPPIRAEAYVPERLNAQLTEQTTLFLKDSHNGLRVKGSTLWVSKIFDWYAADFLPAASRRTFATLTAEKLLAVLHPYLNPDLVRIMEEQKLVVRFLDYDWTLNDQAR